MQPKKAYSKIKGEFLRSFNNGCKEITVDSLIYIIDKSRSEIISIALRVRKEFYEEKSIYMIRLWTTVPRKSIRAFKPCDGSSVDTGLVKGDIDIDLKQVQGRGEALIIKTDCAEHLKFLKPPEAKEIKKALPKKKKFILLPFSSMSPSRIPQ